MNTVMRTIGGVVGGQIGAAILSADTIGATSVPEESAFVAAFAVSAGVAVVAAVLGLFARSRPRVAALRPAEVLD